MNAVIAIMSANNIIAERNTQAQRETFIKHLFDSKRLHNYDVVFYTGGNSVQDVSELSEHVYLLKCVAEDDIRHTFEKTCEAYEYILSHFDADMMIRCNISCYLNVDLIDAVLESAYNGNYIVANRFNLIINVGDFLNKPYPRGDFYMLRMDWVKSALPYKDTLFDYNKFNIDCVDDTKFGMCLMNADYDTYKKSMRFCAYGFLPYDDAENMQPIFLDARVKTIPRDAKCSGYSWTDEKVREGDVKKMQLLYERFKSLSTDTYTNKNARIESCFLRDSDITDMVGCRCFRTTFADVRKSLN